MESFSDLGAILLMQGFNGLSVFSVLLLMALGLAIIFGQMGVINMAHGEFLAVGAYCTYLCSELVQQYAPGLMPAYFFVAILLAFAVTFSLGWLVEWLMIRHLYRRPLDTLL
ncbi:MAG: ABC transporter permease subunit, partial [Achromobacter sp.]